MPFLRQSTAAILKIGPFVDDGDGSTPAEGLSIAQGDIQLSKNGGALAQTSDGSPTTTHDADGWYPIPLTTTDTNTVGRLTVKVAMAGALPVWREYQVVEEAVFDAMYAASATGFSTHTAVNVRSEMDSNSTELAKIGTIPALDSAAQTIGAAIGKLADDNAGADFDAGTDSQLAIASAVTGAASTGSASNEPVVAEPGGFTLTTGTNEVNDEDSTRALDGTEHTWDDDGGSMDGRYLFNTGGAFVPVSLQIVGRLNGTAGDEVQINVNTGTVASPVFTPATNQRGSIIRTGGATNAVHIVDLFASDIMTGADAGKVQIQITDDGGVTSATFAVDQMFVAKTSVASPTGYSLGACWLDLDDGTAGTVSDVNGTADNPALTLAEARTIMTAKNLHRLHVAPTTSTLTLASSSDGLEFFGFHWILALNSQSISNAIFSGASVSGTGTGANDAHFDDCHIQAVTLPATDFHDCMLHGVVTLSAADTYHLGSCSSESGAVIDFAAVGASTVYMPGWKGSALEIRNMDTGDVLYIEGEGILTINANCTAGTVNIEGNVGLVNNGSGQTINRDARIADVSDTALQKIHRQQTNLTTWYVDKASGNDSNDGTSEDQAFETIAAAISAASSDHVIRIARGAYTEQGDFETASLTDIWLQGAGKDAVTITHSTNGEAALVITSGMRVSDLSPIATGTDSFGIVIGSTSDSDILIEGVDATGTKDGMLFAGGSKITLRRSTGTSTYDGIAFQGTTDFLAEDCQGISTCTHTDKLGRGIFISAFGGDPSGEIKRTRCEAIRTNDGTDSAARTAGISIDAGRIALDGNTYVATSANEGYTGRVNGINVTGGAVFDRDGMVITSDAAVGPAVDLRQSSGTLTIKNTQHDSSKTVGTITNWTADEVWDELLTGATHNIATSAGRVLRELDELVGYEGGAVWLDTVNGAAGDTPGDNGTVDNPTNNITDAITIAVAKGLVRIRVASGSTVTLVAALEGYEVFNANWTLALGGQSISGSCITGATVSGTCTGASAPKFVDCHFGAVTIPPSHLSYCGFTDTVTAGSAGTFFFDSCHSGVAGTGAPVFDFGSGLNASNVNYRAYSGGVDIRNMGAGSGSYKMSLEGHGQLIVNANCSATSTIAIRGHFTVSGDSTAIAAITFSDDARFHNRASIEAILVDTATTIPAAIAAVQADLPSAPTKNVALNDFPFFMVLSSDHVTGGTGLTVTAQRSIDGGAFGNAANAVVEIGNGIYKIDLTAADMDGDTICLKFTAATADARIITIVTQPT